MHKRPKVNKGTIKRLMGYITGRYKARFIIVLICILLSALANVAASLFLRVLIDDFITPLLAQAHPVFTGLFQAMLLMGGIYLLGVLSTFLFNRLMVTISQGVLKDIRDQMFAHMQTLPIKYFDTHTHGDVMSYYTNDTDTLRQMISQSIPQMFSSLITVVAVFCAMLATSIPLTLLLLVCVTAMLLLTKKIVSKSGGYFIRQQRSLGKVNGYIEEMIHGQKVVKVFCHEEAAKKDFDQINDELFENAYAANKFANILMPIMGNLGKPPVRAHRHCRRGHGHQRHAGPVAGRHRDLPPADQELLHAHQPDFPAGQCGGHGSGRRGAHLPADG